MVSSQVLVTDLIDAVNSEGKSIKYIEEESVPYSKYITILIMVPKSYKGIMSEDLNMEMDMVAYKW